MGVPFLEGFLYHSHITCGLEAGLPEPGVWELTAASLMKQGSKTAQLGWFSAQRYHCMGDLLIPPLNTHLQTDHEARDPAPEVIRTAASLAAASLLRARLTP